MQVELNLEAQEVAPWMEMTVWVPPVDEYAGFGSASIERAKAAGLTFRPLADTARDTLAWWNTLDEDRRSKPRAGLAADKEGKVLAAWRGRGSSESPTEAAS